MVGSGGAKGRRGPSSGLGGGSDETTGLESSRSWVGLKSIEDKHQAGDGGARARRGGS